MSLRDHIPFLRRRRTPGPMACRELVDLATAYIEGTLPDADRERLEFHLSLCEGCRMYIDQMRDTLQMLGRIEPDDVSPAAYDELSKAFGAWKAERSA
jgi:predicted anti-sigma-YlaC factor YlaD